MTTFPETLLSRARKCRDEGKFHQALLAYKECQNSAQKAEMREIVVICMHEVGLVYIAEKQYDQARSQYNTALAEVRRTNYPVLEGNILRDLGLLFLVLGDREEAKKLLLESKEVLVKTQDVNSFGTTVAKLARLHVIEAQEKTDSEEKLLLLFLAQDTLQEGLSFIKTRVFFKANVLKDVLRVLIEEEHVVFLFMESIYAEIEKSEVKTFSQERFKIAGLLIIHIWFLVKAVVRIMFRIVFIQTKHQEKHRP